MRKQTCDLISLLRAAAPLSHDFMFMEASAVCVVGGGGRVGGMVCGGGGMFMFQVVCFVCFVQINNKMSIIKKE